MSVVAFGPGGSVHFVADPSGPPESVRLGAAVALRGDPAVRAFLERAVLA